MNVDNGLTLFSLLTDNGGNMDIQYKKIDQDKYEQWLYTNGFLLYDICNGNRYYRKQFAIGVMEFVAFRYKFDFGLEYDVWKKFIDDVVFDLLKVFSQQETEAIIESWYTD